MGVDADAALDQAADAGPLMAVQIGAAAGREADAVGAQQEIAGRQACRAARTASRASVTPAAAASARGRARSSSNRQQVAPAVPAASVAAPSPCQASPSLKVRSAMVTPPCTTKIMRGNGGSASVAVVREDVFVERKHGGHERPFLAGGLMRQP